MANLKSALIAKTNPVAVKEDARGSVVKTYFYFNSSNQAYDAKKVFEEDMSNQLTCYIREATHKGVTYQALVIESDISLGDLTTMKVEAEENAEKTLKEWENKDVVAEHKHGLDENTLEDFDELPEIVIESVSQETLDNMTVQPTKVSYTLEVYATRDMINGQNLDPNKWMSLTKWNKGLGESNFNSLELARNEKQRLLDNVLFGVTAVRIFQTSSTHVK